MQKITPFLWFDGNAKEAVDLYVSIFKEASIDECSYYDEENVMSVSFQLFGQEYIAFNGGPELKFSAAISLFVNCETQEEIDFLWEKLSEGGHELQCGWVTDRFGVTWQIVPSILPELLGSDDEEKAERAMQAMLQMKKLSIQRLLDAFNGE